MTIEERIAKLLETILETNAKPESVCQEFPELMPLVQERLDQMKRIERQLDEFFPCTDSMLRSGSLSRTGRERSRVDCRRLPLVDGYDIEGILGSGGMGVVYKARHQRLNRVVALKMLLAGPYATANELTRFSRECQAIAELHCPHIVQIHDVGDVEGRPFFTMEFVEGGSLAEHLAGVPQAAQKSAELTATLAEAIESAHRKGIVHRDLKPANILLSAEGCPKIADFGLARHIECEHPLTITGVNLGTPSYMAPEQVVGSTQSIGPAVDIYALGAILYEMLTGRPPFRAESAHETQRQVVNLEPVPPARVNASVPRDLETICLTCLSKQPERRYSSASELAADLQRFLRHEPIQARPTNRSQRAVRWIRRNPLLFALGITAVALITLSLAFAIREVSAAEQRQAESDKWQQRLGFVNDLEQEGRFAEARAILGRVPDGGSMALQRQIQTAQIELELAERLDSVRMSRGKFVQGGGIDYAESCRKYAEVFQAGGVGQWGANPVDVANRIKASTVRVALISALDDWAVCETMERRDWILSVVRLADPDPWRDQVRSQQEWASIENLERLATEVDIGQQPIALLVAMGTRWRRLGGDPREYLNRVQRCYPDDFWVNFELAHLYAFEDVSKSIAYNFAALAIRPNATAVHFNLGGVFERLRQTEDANYHYGRVLESDPEHTWAHYRFALTQFDLGHSREALQHFQKALDLDPQFKDARNGLRIAFMKLGQLESAATVWNRILGDPSATHEDLDGYAELLLYLGQEQNYHQVCKDLLERFESTHSPLVCERLARACLLKPNSAEIQMRATRLIDRALAQKMPDDQQWAVPYLMFAKALSDYREGRNEEAINGLRGPASTVLQPAPDLVLALVLDRLGDHEQSLEARKRAFEFFKSSQPLFNREAWMFEILRRETLALDRDIHNAEPETAAEMQQNLQSQPK